MSLACGSVLSVTNKTRNWMIAAATTLGIAMLVIGALLPEDAYITSVLANLGTTLLLAIPLIWLERWFERRLEQNAAAAEESIEILGDRLNEVGSTVADVDRRLDELASRTNAAVSERRQEELAQALEPFAEMRRNPTYRTIYQAMNHERRDACYVPLQAERIILRFKGIEDQKGQGIEVKAIRDDKDPWLERRPAKRPIARRPPIEPSYTWRPDESVEHLFVHLDASLRQGFGEQQAPTIDAKRVITGLADTLTLASKKSRSLGAAAPVLAVPSAHWVVFQDRLEHLDDPAHSFLLGTKSGIHPPAVLNGEIPHADELPYAWLIAVQCYADRFLRK